MGRGGGGAMAPDDFKKWQCPLSLFFLISVDFKIVQCPLLILKNSNDPFRYF